MEPLLTRRDATHSDLPIGTLPAVRRAVCVVVVDAPVVVPMPPLRRIWVFAFFVVAMSATAVVAMSGWLRWLLLAPLVMGVVLALGWQLDRRPQAVLGPSTVRFKRWGFRSSEIRYADISSITHREPRPNRSLFFPKMKALPDREYKAISAHTGALIIHARNRQRFWIGDPSPLMSLRMVEHELRARIETP